MDKQILTSYLDLFKLRKKTLEKYKTKSKPQEKSTEKNVRVW